MIFEKVNDFYWYFLKNLKKYERKLIKYQGFGDRSIIRFKRDSGLEWNTIAKILNSIKILDGLELRKHIRAIYSENIELFENPNTYVTHFGPVEKSGTIILNQFSRCFKSMNNKIIAISKLNELPPDASIIFLDDFIGTGQQGLGYIKNISQILNSNIQPYLFTICGTQDGLDFINNFRSNFVIKSQIILSKENDHLLDPINKVLEEHEKKKIRELNQLIGLGHKNKYQLGLPFAFYYSAPDNALGILWGDGFEYLNEGIGKKWYGLIPRDY